MAPSTRLVIANNNNGDEGITREYLDSQLAEMRNLIATLGLQHNQDMNQGRQANQFGRLAKEESPKFQGDDVRGWAFRCDQFFSIENTLNEEKVKIVSVHLFDKALLWHRQFLSVSGENIGWEVYKNASIIQRFGLIFEDLMSTLKNANLYLGGLPTELEMSVRMFKPATLVDAYSLTMLHEAILDAMKKKNKPSGSFNRNRFGNGGNYGNVTKPVVLPKPNTPVTTYVRKQISPKEYQEKRAQNLCFYCDHKYSPGHKCAGQLFSLVLVPDEEDYFEDCLDDEEENETSMGIQELQPQISLNALTGINNFQTMRVINTVGQHVVHILVDCGSTHNFLDKNMAKKLGCSIRPTGPLAVTVADDNNLVTTYECKNFQWKFDNTTFTTDVMFLPLRGCEMLRGTHKSNVVWLNNKNSEKTTRQVVQGEFHSMDLCVYPVLEGMPVTVDGKIQAVLENYEDVFGIPVELPQQRTHDHKIPLVEGTLPVNIRPYRHPPTQKDAIEAMVKELLEAGVINKNHSPFASPIVMCLEEHVRHLQIILETMRTHKLFAKLSKCVFGTTQVEYLGHVISAQEGLSKDFAMISRPLTRLLKKGAYEWNRASQIEFEALKQDMISAPVLKLPDFTKEFTIETDASGGVIGAVLLQEGHPIAFLSKTLSAKHQLKSIYEKELLAVVVALKK
ncbi:RNA-directed DNA polymerase like protein [Tanacetum coccineum]|uniref:RNA-directed DNA polymerase like protein n=1 Tax=Tanacetum coccineum TaxID=301880 RepID=A0ABQ5F4Q3_9ASTR